MVCNKLCAAPGFAETLVYRHYENKHCLLTYLVGRHWAWLCFRVRMALHNAAHPRLHQALAAVGEANADDLVPVMQAANPRRAHSHAVVSTLLEAARNPFVYAQHLPLLTDSDGNVRCFLKQLAALTAPMAVAATPAASHGGPPPPPLATPIYNNRTLAVAILLLPPIHFLIPFYV